MLHMQALTTGLIGEHGGQLLTTITIAGAKTHNIRNVTDRTAL